MNQPVPRFTKGHAEQLEAYDWPGNIRELQNTVERAVILAQGGPLHFDLPKRRVSQPLPSRDGSTLTPVLLTREERKAQERESIVEALKQTEGKVFGVGGAAELLGMKPTTLVSRIKALGIPKN